MADPVTGYGKTLKPGFPKRVRLLIIFDNIIGDMTVGFESV